MIKKRVKVSDLGVGDQFVFDGRVFTRAEDKEPYIKCLEETYFSPDVEVESLHPVIIVHSCTEACSYNIDGGCFHPEGPCEDEK